jgi:hypothetical protein
MGVDPHRRSRIVQVDNDSDISGAGGSFPEAGTLRGPTAAASPGNARRTFAFPSAGGAACEWSPVAGKGVPCDGNAPLGFISHEAGA